MKKVLLLLGLAIFFSCKASSQSTGGFTINGSIADLAGETINVHAFTLDMDNLELLATTKADSDGVWVLKGSIDEPFLAMLSYGEGDEADVFFEFFIENVTYDIAVVDDEFMAQGGDAMMLFLGFSDAIDQVDDIEQVKGLFEDFITENSDSPVSAFLVHSQIYALEDGDFATRMYESLSSRIKGTELGKAAKKSVSDMVAILNSDSKEAGAGGCELPGEPFTDFTTKDVNGNTIKLSDVAGKGKWVLLDFWASWCGPCRAENPHVVSAYEEYKDKGFTVFGYSLDQNDAAWKAAIKKDNVGQWTNASDLKGWDSPASKAYGVRGIPASFMISPEGKIVATNLRGADLTRFLKENL